MAPVVASRIEGLSSFLRALKEYAPDLRKQFVKRARLAAGIIAAEARSNAAWSTRIPGAISPVTTSTGVGVRVSKKKAPHAGLYERGGQGGRGSFRHPLFGDENYWFTQSIRPFLAPALKDKSAEVITAMVHAVEETTKELDLR